MNMKTGSIYDWAREEVKDFTVNGECSGCGNCCSNILPMNEEEISRLRKWVKKNHYEAHRCNYPFAKEIQDLTCPFRNEKENKCDIYEIRPTICKDYRCDKFKNGDKPIAIKDARIVFLREEIFK